MALLSLLFLKIPGLLEALGRTACLREPSAIKATMVLSTYDTICLEILSQAA